MATEIVRPLALLVSLAFVVSCGGGGGSSGGGVPANRAPVAAISGPSSSDIGVSVAFDGSASSDPDGDALTYRWTLSAPSGSTASLSGVAAARATLVPDVPGSYRLQLVVNDSRLDSAPADHTLTVNTPSPIKATLQTPLPGGLVSNPVSVVVTVVSTYEVSAVTATLAGRETTLAFAPDAWCPRGECGPGFAGTVSLAGQSPGSYTLTIRATDVRGNSNELSVAVRYDNPPRLAVTEPVDLSVAMPTVPLDARCSDDLPGCIVELLVNGKLQLSAPSELSEPLDLSAWMGTSVGLTLRARDSAGQLIMQDRVVFVEDSARLTAVTELPGLILDADDRRLLFLEHGDAGDRLAIHDRISGLTENVVMPDGRTVRAEAAYLTPTGAIFVTQGSGGNVLTSRVYLWRSGALTDLAYPNSAASLSVSGDYAIWNESTNLYRLNTTTVASALIASDAGNWQNSVAADGTVVFWNTSYQIVRDRLGQQTVLTNDPSQWHVYPRTDGDKVVYRRQDPCCANQQYMIVLVEGADLIPLSAKRDSEPSPGRDYQIDSGWAAYTDTGNLGQLHVFTRSPQGVITGHTDLGTSSRLDHLAGNGEVMIFNGERRYFSRGTGLIAVSSAAGRGYWLNGSWYVAIGRVFLSVDTRD